jgi:hypothetical protein
MPIDAKHEDLQGLRIDRSERGASNGEPPAWARRYIVIGIVVVAVLSLSVMAYRLLARDVRRIARSAVPCFQRRATSWLITRST